MARVKAEEIKLSKSRTSSQLHSLSEKIVFISIATVRKSSVGMKAAEQVHNALFRRSEGLCVSVSAGK